jgi:hypothetical protein
MEGARNLTPREVWAMRIDEACCICASRVALLKQSQGESSGRTKSSNGGGWRDLGNGSKSRNITGMKDLYAAFGANLPDGFEV